MSEFVYPYDTRTGEQVKHPVPRRWIGHPVLGKHLSMTKPTTKTPTTKPGKSGDDKSKED